MSATPAALIALHRVLCDDIQPNRDGLHARLEEYDRVYAELRAAGMKPNKLLEQVFPRTVEALQLLFEKVQSRSGHAAIGHARLEE
jgi:hypothetical protein